MSGTQRLAEGYVLKSTTARLSAQPEGALWELWLAMVLLAAGLVAVRL